eukprot:Protomagalhaensia_sp_Gyna_25__4939@NODE_532_length_3194_cov_386_550238_g416_i0_p2_GENE_NODE_532_length_3194_cov_386_550238_g416_i0NODE_532_length_3194_cov_386_550238_g416_i0_p2_ORF_typecomplete_len311_score4_65DHHC/PF01529_20/4_9e02DHHC/PF01529_20/5_7e37CobD_Cbib/PF03186_13/0_27CobD_Cbib/PF03186_13/42Zf_RING/PF16744_5/1_2_NODE_532_length_3194_cov_386_550238_g416_i022003132
MQYELLQEHGVTGSPGATRAAEQSLPTALRRRRTQPAGGYCFLLVVLTVVALMYCIYFVCLLYPLLNEPTLLHLAIFTAYHLYFALFLFALFQSGVTDPGSVPAHWGFYVGEESKRRRYCRVCNVWKPDRTHHCSTCGRCVLNMDHHCPWINNCVGFFNRKFFIQVLWYAIICLAFLVTHGLYFLAVLAHQLWPADYRSVVKPRSAIDMVSYAAVLGIVLFSTILLGALIPFTKFHMGLLVHNSTTIESMDPSFREHSKYDLGTRRNIEQVFGANAAWWWLPLHLPSSRPIGDGVRWRRHYLRAMDEEGA